MFRECSFFSSVGRNKHPYDGIIQLVHWADGAFGAHCPLYWGITRYHPSPVEQWADIESVYNPTCMYKPRQSKVSCRAAILRGLVGSALDVGAAFQFAFPVKAPFPGSTCWNPSEVTF